MLKNMPKEDGDLKEIFLKDEESFKNLLPKAQTLGIKKRVHTVAPLRDLDGKVDIGIMKRFFDEMYGTRTLF